MLTPRWGAGALAAAVLTCGCSGGVEPPPPPATLAGRIVFVSDTGRYPLLHMRPDGTDVRAIPVEPGGFVGGVDVSPDGEWLVLDFSPGGHWDIVTMRSDGTGWRNLTSTLYVSERGARWSPDGQEIVFASQAVPDASDLLIMKADGTNRRYLATAAGEELQPHLSPDAATLVFAFDTAVQPDYLPVIMTMKLATSERVPLTGFGVADNYPSWSPDGSRIAFISARGPDPGIRNPWGLWVMNADGSGLQSVVPGDSFYVTNDPRWSPDGTRLTADGSGTFRIFSLDGHTVAGPFAGRHPTWGPAEAP